MSDSANIYSAQSLNPVVVADNLTKAVNERLHYQMYSTGQVLVGVGNLSGPGTTGVHTLQHEPKGQMFLYVDLFRSLQCTPSNHVPLSFIPSKFWLLSNIQ